MTIQTSPDKRFQSNLIVYCSSIFQIITFAVILLILINEESKEILSIEQFNIFRLVIMAVVIIDFFFIHFLKRKLISSLHPQETQESVTAKLATLTIYDMVLLMTVATAGFVLTFISKDFSYFIGGCLVFAFVFIKLFPSRYKQQNLLQTRNINLVDNNGG